MNKGIKSAANRPKKLIRWNFWADAELQAYNLTALQLPGWESYCCNTQLDANQALKYLTPSYNSWYSPLYQSSHIAEQERSKSIPIVQNMYMKSRAKPKKSSVCLFLFFGISPQWACLMWGGYQKFHSAPPATMVPSHNRVHYESGKLGSRLIQSPKEFVANLSEEIQGVPKNVLIEQNHNQNWVLWG